MSTNKYKWLTLGLTSIVISGCAVGSKPNLNLGIADAFRKSKSCLFKKKLGYEATAPSFGYAQPASTSVPVSLPTQDDSITLSDVTVSSDQAGSVVTSGCGCNSSVPVPTTEYSEFYMPIVPAQEVVHPPVTTESIQTLPVTALPFENGEDTQQLENPLPAPVTVPSDSVSPPTDIDPTEEEGIIETLDDSASIDLDDLQEEVEQEVMEEEVIEEEFTITPKKDENSILDTAVKVLQPQAPTSAGESVVEQRSKMLTLTARPVQSHHSSHSQLQRNKVEMQQVTHKRHFRQQNALRPLHRERYEHTAEAPGPVKFKQLPTISKESPTGKTSDVNTGAPALNRSSSSEVMERSSPKMQRLPSSVEKLESETEKDSVIKIARLPILRAESTSSAAIGSLRNFTNVRDLDPGFDKGYYSRKKTEDAALKAVEVLSDDVVDPITE